jgi:hypothetical protein
MKKNNNLKKKKKKKKKKKIETYIVLGAFLPGFLVLVATNSEGDDHKFNFLFGKMFFYSFFLKKKIMFISVFCISFQDGEYLEHPIIQI